MNQNYLFKKSQIGTSKKEKPYHMIELHDPTTLDNTTFFVEEGVKIDCEGLQLKDKVQAELEIVVEFGKPAIKLRGLKKVV